MDRIQAIRRGQNVPARRPRGPHVPIRLVIQQPVIPAQVPIPVIPVFKKRKHDKRRGGQSGKGSNPNVKSYSPYEILLPNDQPINTLAIPSGDRIAN